MFLRQDSGAARYQALMRNQMVIFVCIVAQCIATFFLAIWSVFSVTREVANLNRTILRLIGAMESILRQEGK